MNEQDTTPSRIERTLTTAVLRGDYAVGMRLPPIRTLATQFDVNPSTVQRALARLERTGLVTTRQGSGILVNDPEACGDVSLVPAWLEAVSDQPERAATILDNLLEVRRILCARLVVRHRERLRERASVLATAADAVEAAAARSPDEMRDADLAFARALLRETGNTVVLAVFNTVARLVTEMPAVAQAMYARPQANARSIHALIAAVTSELDDASLSAAIEHAIEAIDRTTVARFRALLQEQA